MIKPFDIRLSIKGTIAWKIIAEVVRNHGGASDLRVLEMHPGGGQYHLLTVYRVRGEYGGVYEPTYVPMVEFNLLSGTMRGFCPGHDENVEWLQIWMNNPDPEMVVDIAIQTLALPVIAELPPTNRRTFGCRLMAALLGAKLLDKDYVVARMGLVDTSGYGGGVHHDLRQFAGIFPNSRSDLDAQISQAGDCWLLYAGCDEKLLGVLRMDGLLSSIAEPESAHDLFARFEQSRSLEKVLTHARGILSL